MIGLKLVKCGRGRVDIVNSRTEHLKWCKERALEYLEEGDLNRAVASMASDLLKHPDVNFEPSRIGRGMLEINAGSEAVRRWIESFE